MLTFYCQGMIWRFHWNSFSMKTISMTGEAAVKFLRTLHSSRKKRYCALQLSYLYKRWDMKCMRSTLDAQKNSLFLVSWWERNLSSMELVLQQIRQFRLAYLSSCLLYLHPTMHISSGGSVEVNGQIQLLKVKYIFAIHWLCLSFSPYLSRIP